MVQKFRNRLYSSAEQGFSLAEMVVVVLILGVLAAISVPVYLGIQNQANVSTIKTGLLQASSLIEQEKTDLNGVYPRYLPNEVMQNELWRNFSYTYSNDRLAYCLQAYDNSDTQWFLSSTNHEPSHDICTLPNVGSNSTLPWAPNTPPRINIDSLVMTWPDGASTPTATMSWGAAQCTNRDKNNVPSTKYKVTITDDSEKTSTVLDNIDGTNLSTDKLPGFLPSDNVYAVIQVVCITQPSSSSQSYTTTGDKSVTPAKAVTPRLPVPATAWDAVAGYGTPHASLTQNTTTKAFTMQTAGGLNPITCSLGTPAYQIRAVQNDPSFAGGSNEQDSTGDANTDKNWILANFLPDKKINYTGNAFCVITRGASANSGLPTSYPSADVTSNEFAPVGWPQAITNLATTSAFSGTGTTPNGLTWTNTQCTFGGQPQYSYVQDFPLPAPANGAYQNNTDTTSTSSAGPISWLQGKSYTYHINAKCKGSNVESVPTASNALKFTTDVTVATPTYATTPAAYFPSDTQMNVKGQFNAITCQGDSTAYYSITAVQGAKSVASNPSTQTSFDLNISALAADTSTTYYGYAYCYVTQYQGSPTATRIYTSAPVTTGETTPIDAPNATTTTANNSGANTDVLPNQMVSSTTSCTFGGTLYYRFYMTSPSSGTSAWSTSNTLTGSFSNGVSMTNLTNGQLYRVGTQVQCQGNNTNSPVTQGATIDFNGYYNKPAAPGAPSSISVSTTNPSQTQTVSWSSVSCNRGGGAQYRLIQNIHNGNNIGDNGAYNTGWFTGTSYNTSGWIDYQGANYQYAVKARCVNANYTSDESGWTFTNTFTEGINTPSAPSSAWNDNRNTVAWNGVGCPAGTRPSYLVNQDYTNGSNYTNYRENRTTNTSTSNIQGSTGGFQRVYVYAYCDSTTGTGASSGQSGGTGTQWTTYGSPSLASNNMGGCGWADVFTYSSCGSSYNSGYPGINGSDVSPNNIGLSFNQSAQLYGTPSTTGQYDLYGILYNPAGNSGWQWLGNRVFNEYAMSAHNASDNWVNSGNTNTYGLQLVYDPCTLNVNCSSAYNMGNKGSSVMKLVTQKTTSATSAAQCRGTSVYGICGQANFAMQGLVPGHSYLASCWVWTGTGVGNGANRAGITGYGMNVSGDTYNVIGSQDETWQLLQHRFTAQATNQTMALFAGNGDTNSIHEWEASGCYVNW